MGDPLCPRNLSFNETTTKPAFLIENTNLLRQAALSTHRVGKLSCSYLSRFALVIGTRARYTRLLPQPALLNVSAPFGPKSILLMVLEVLPILTFYYPTSHPILTTHRHLWISQLTFDPKLTQLCITHRFLGTSHLTPSRIRQSWNTHRHWGISHRTPVPPN